MIGPAYQAQTGVICANTDKIESCLMQSLVDLKKCTHTNDLVVKCTDMDPDVHEN